MSPTPPGLILSLSDPLAADPTLSGGKASRLAQLAGTHEVPAGVVISTVAIGTWLSELSSLDAATILDADLSVTLVEALEVTAQALGFPLAVRSSGVAEDLEGASFAGQYETVLDVVDMGALCRAVCVCVASAFSDRVEAYRKGRDIGPAPMAVLIQRMIPATAAGVAFTAHPVTGDRGVTLVSAVAGLGESLVSGSADADEWEVRGGAARCVRRSDVIDETLAIRVAALAERVAGSSPTDIEWAIAADDLYLLQARPMTALPEPARWEPPHSGGYIRNFRLGEWMGTPMTPLTDTWLITDLDRRLHDNFGRLFGAHLAGPTHVTVNGWYFYGGFNFDFGLAGVMRALAVTLWNLPRHFNEMVVCVPPLAHLGFDAETRRWREELIPAYRAAKQALGEVDPTDAVAIVKRLQAAIDAAGVQLSSIVGVAGYAAKAELPLVALWDKHLTDVDGDLLELVVGTGTLPAAHDVEGLDWSLPTLGERGPLPSGPGEDVRSAMEARRTRILKDVETALSPRLWRKFAKQLEHARAAHAVRLEQTHLFTLAWPEMRAALRRLGDILVQRGVLNTPDDVHYLRRDELAYVLEGKAPTIDIAERRANWKRQCRLVPPLVIGDVSGILGQILTEIDGVFDHEERQAPDAICGMSGSAGRVTGIARVIRNVDDLYRLQKGEILVAPVTTPAWTMAFDRAIAVVTDTGSVASHASIVAREHGIPCVVGTGNATGTINDGARITVDGARGVVRTRV